MVRIDLDGDGPMASKAEDALRVVSADDGCLTQPPLVGSLLAQAFDIRAHPGEQHLGRDRRCTGPLQHPDLALVGPDLSAHSRDLVPDPVDLYGALRSSGTSPNFRITWASPKSLVAGSPLRLKATAPT
jgi:hypothetical protein